MGATPPPRASGWLFFRGTRPARDRRAPDGVAEGFREPEDARVLRPGGGKGEKGAARRPLYSSMPRAQIGVGLVGAGFLAETRARCYARVAGVDARLAAVVARRPERARAFAGRHGVARATRSLDELLGMDEVDVVDLCVPNLLHREMAEAAARAGKHVICTKPLTAYVGQDLGGDATDEDVSSTSRAKMLEVATADAEAMVRAAREAGVRLFYGENWIYSPAVQRAARLLAASGGAVLEMRGWECHNGSHSEYSKLWRYTGGGALIRLGAHPIGAMLYLQRLQGARPVSVTAEVGDLTRAVGDRECFVARGWKDVENWGCAILAFDDGSRGVAHGSDNLLGGMESKLEVLASNCHLKCNLSPSDVLRAYAPAPEVFADEYLMEKLDTKAGWSTPMPDEDWTSGHLPMCAAFLRAIAEGGEAESDGELGLEVTRVVYAAYLAAAEGRRVEL